MKLKTMRRAYFWEAAVMVIVAQLARRLLAPARIFAWADRSPRRIHRFAGDEASCIAWATESFRAKPWMNADCLSRALAAHAMLRRRGMASRLCLGVAREENELVAFAWVEIGTQKIIGGTETAGLTRLAQFGGTS